MPDYACCGRVFAFNRPQVLFLIACAKSFSLWTAGMEIRLHAAIILSVKCRPWPFLRMSIQSILMILAAFMQPLRYGMCPPISTGEQAAKGAKQICQSLFSPWLGGCATTRHVEPFSRQQVSR